jgi:hypothetical protein
VDAGEGYEVDEFRVDYNPVAGFFAWLAESGCSCWEGYPPGIEEGTASLEIYDGYGSAQEAHSALDTWAKEDNQYRFVYLSSGALADAHLAIANHS